MPPDLQTYRSYVDGFDLTEEQKAELIHTVWSIMESFVDRAFGLHPVQQCRAAASGVDSNAGRESVDSSGQSISTQFKQAG